MTAEENGAHSVDRESGRTFCYLVSQEHAGERIDSFLASRIPELTRSRLQDLIRRGHVRAEGRIPKPSYHLRPGDRITVAVPPPRSCGLEPESVEFTVVHEDQSIIVLDKPPGVVVHPAAGHATGTLVHGLLARCEGLSGIGGVVRPGIVHRLDRDTSGLMVVAKNDMSHEALARQFKEGGVNKQYSVLVHGLPAGETGEIDLPIGRNPRRRKEMAVVPGTGKRALTHWRVEERYPAGFARLRVSLKTGRTHQIRVHLAHLGHPVLGDKIYGRKGRSGPAAARQMLHAELLGFLHPDTGSYCEYRAPLPADMKAVMDGLKGMTAPGEIP